MRCGASRERWSEVGLWVDVAMGPSSPAYLPVPQVQVDDTPVPGRCWLVMRALLGNRMRASGEGNMGEGAAGSPRCLWECGGVAPVEGFPEGWQGTWCRQRQQQCPGSGGGLGGDPALPWAVGPGSWRGEPCWEGPSGCGGGHPIPHGAQMRLPGPGHTARGGCREAGEGLRVCPSVLSPSPTSQSNSASP